VCKHNANIMALSRSMFAVDIIATLKKLAIDSDGLGAYTRPTSAMCREEGTEYDPVGIH
jgi:hypothetical protein